MNALSTEKPLRLWPGVVGAIIVVFARFVIAPFVPGAGLIGVLAGNGRCRAHPSLVALLQPRSVVGADRRGPADRTGRRHDAAPSYIPRSAAARRGRDVVHVPASRDRPAIPGRGGHPVPAILARGSMDDDGGGDSPGQRRVGPRAHRRHRGGGQPAARLAMDADRGGATAHCGARRNATVTASANGGPTNGFIVGKRRRLTPLPSPRFPPAIPGRRTSVNLRLPHPSWRQSFGADSVAGTRNDAVDGVRINSDWNAAKPTQIWRRRVGPGWSSFAVAGELIFTQEQRGDYELISAYRLSTGEPVWRHQDAARFYEPAGGAGPRGTPTVHDGRVYAMGATGIVNALDATTGARIWTRNAERDTGARRPDWAFAASPLVVGDVLVTAASGRLVAYDLTNGTPRWTQKTSGGGYSSPHLATLAGVPQILLMNGGGITSVGLDGSILWASHAEAGVGDSSSRRCSRTAACWRHRAKRCEARACAGSRCRAPPTARGRSRSAGRRVG